MTDLNDFARQLAAIAPPLSAQQSDKIGAIMRPAISRTAASDESGASRSKVISNPFGHWTKHRATIAALSRLDARNEEAEARARNLLFASRLADKIIEVREELTPEQRETMKELLG